MDFKKFGGESDAIAERMDHTTKEARVAAFLREGIISGRFPRGSRLKQTEIASALRSSSTPVREALKLLQAEGYVQASSYRGCIVAPFDLASAHEVATLRMSLEPQLVRGAIANMTPITMRELTDLSRDYVEAAKASDRARARALNYRFHWLIYGTAGAPMTAHFVQILWAKYPFDLQLLASSRVEHSVSEHSEVLEAIALNDIAAAMMSMRNHIELGWKDLRDWLRTNQAVDGSERSLPSTSVHLEVAE